MADFTLVDPKGWEYDLHSVYSAYIGYFQMYNVPWYERSWGHLFESFEEFLAFSWPVITVTDASSGRAHIVTRLNSIGAFIKMIKTRFGETLPQAPNILQISPFENSSRHLRHVSDYSSYKKLHSTLPAVVLSALKTRVRSGEPKAIKDLWGKKDKTFLAIDFEWNERNEKTVLEWGYAAVRCGHLESLGHWPPVPDTNYRKGHYIVAEHVDKVINKYCPTYPWLFGESQVIPKAKLPQIIQAVISSLASPDSETTPNQLVIVGHNVHSDLMRLEEMKIRIPHNTLIVDTMIYERNLYANGFRGVMPDPKSDKPRLSGSNLSLENLLYSLTLPTSSNSPSPDSGQRQPSPLPPVVLPQCTLHNAGNDALMTLFAFQKLLEPRGTQVPTLVKKAKANGSGFSNKFNAIHGGGMPVGMMPMSMPMSMPSVNGAGAGVNGTSASVLNTSVSMPMMNITGTTPASFYAGFTAIMPSLSLPQANGNGTSNGSLPRRSSTYDLADEFGQMQLGKGQRPNNGSGTAAPQQQYVTSPSRLGPGRATKRVSSFPTARADE
ncbi:hypothetical protein JR316_0000202 [Psilocybe cubensis]|uniref:Uncharacterized protein n=2 Tax=Psilocybe cubensis TaxID=181762 RepID=A0ACB8HDP3_PSICU|nr:hypothetical protein JR316_0000202 [Psilocybe cubensis]KAH9486138.1 hypothetical protein JR316_0000202 [Psilocybe cubensis]